MSYHNDPRNTPELLAALASHGLQAVSPSQLSDAFRIAWWAQEATIARLTAELAEAISEMHDLASSHAARAERAEAERDALIGAAYEARPALTAPQDGTLVRLLLDYSDEENWTPLEDEMQAWTIGYNTLADTGEDEWIIVGWNWSQDCWCEGSGKIIGWLPFVSEAPSDATAALDRIRAEAELAGWKRGRDDAAAHMDNASANCRKQFTYPPKTAEQRDWQTGALLHANAAKAIRALTPPADLAARLVTVLPDLSPDPRTAALVEAAKNTLTGYDQWANCVSGTPEDTIASGALLARVNRLRAALAAWEA